MTELLEQAKQTCSDPVVLIEQRVDFSRWVKEGFGTADCIIIADGMMNIVDYKHGKGVEVSAEANPQMMLYEVIVEADMCMSEAVLSKQMGRIPAWADDLLLRADGYETFFYKKD